MAFFKETIVKPISIVWLVLTGGASMLAVFVDLEGIGVLVKTLSVLSVSSITAFFVLLFQSHKFFQRARSPASIKKVIEGTHHYAGRLVVIFDKSPWISIGQVLVLVQESDDVQLPIALASIETTTTKGFPQAVILSPLSTEDISKYLSDSSRWKNIIGLPDIKYNYIAEVANA
jgi:hypothetical protein